MARIQLVSGKIKNFADQIIDFAGVDRESLIVSTFGISLSQANRLVCYFESVIFNIDASHKTLNPTTYENLCKLAQLENVRILATYNHAKIAIINKKKAVITSANLTANHKTECYVFFDDIDELKGAWEYIKYIENIDDESVTFDMQAHRAETVFIGDQEDNFLKIDFPVNI